MTRIPHGIVEIDTDGNIIGRWTGAKAAASATGYTWQYIIGCCIKHWDTKDGRRFRYDGNTADKPDYPCVTCRSFSASKGSVGFCMKWRRGVRLQDTCGEHRYERNIF